MNKFLCQPDLKQKKLGKYMNLFFFFFFPQRKSYLASLKLWNCKVLITIYPFFFLPKNKQLRLIAILQFWVLENNYAWVL